MDDLRDVVLAEQAHEEGLGHLGITVFLKEEVEDGSVFIHSPPHPELDPADLDARLVQMSPRTLLGFSVMQLLGEQRRESVSTAGHHLNTAMPLKLQYRTTWV